MTDLSKTIIPKSDQMNSDDLMAGPRTVVITKVTGSESGEQPINIFFEGDGGKPYRPCKIMRRLMVHIWGPDGATYPGRAMTLYRDPTVKWGGVEVGGIRISHMTGIQKPQTVALAETRGVRKPHVVRPLTAPQTRQEAANPKLDPKVYARAEQAARKGKDAFTKWWNSDEGKENRDALRPSLPALQKLVAEAGKPPAEEDPFAGGDAPPKEDEPAQATAEDPEPVVEDERELPEIIQKLAAALEAATTMREVGTVWSDHFDALRDLSEDDYAVADGLMNARRIDLADTE